MKKLILTIILCLPGILPVFSQWNNNSMVNTPVCTSTLDQDNVDIVSDSKGGAIIAWVDQRNSSSQSEIFVQRINSFGIIQWTVNGVSICSQDSNQAAVAITEDGQGGVFLAWNDFRNGNRDVYAQSIDSLGQIRWAIDGIPVCTKPFDQRTPKLISDGAAGVIIVWEDSSSLSDFDIYAQKLTSNGTQAWTTGGVSVCNAAYVQGGPRIESDSSGGAIIVWQDKRNSVDNDIYCQRINGVGTAQWATNGVFVASVIYSQKNPKIKSDKTGGAIMVWQDNRNNGTDSSGVFAQRVNASGQMQWTTNGVAICTAIGGQAQIDVTNEDISGAIICWRDKRNGLDADIYAQKIDLSGTVSWATNGIPIASVALDQQNPSICGDGTGGAILCWEDSRNTMIDIYTQRINGSGLAQWALNGLVAGNANDDQLAPKNIMDGNGGSIYAWADFRNGNDFDVYAHHLFANGNTTTKKEATNDNEHLNAFIFPNPVLDKGMIRIFGINPSEKPFSLTIFDAFGKEVKHQVILEATTALSLDGLCAGFYVFSLQSEDEIEFRGNFVVNGQ